MESYDVVVVGAGIYGLAAAKTYHQLNQDKSVIILDADSTLGGVWAKDRLYPTLKTNNMLGTFEFPDFPMDSETFGVKPGDHIPGDVMHRYLTKYAEQFGIIDKIRYRTKVVVAERQDEIGTDSERGWKITVSVENGVSEEKIFARRLIVATGLTSEAFLPVFKGERDFEAPIFHTKDLHFHADDAVKCPTVFGGTKSAWDAVYSYATKGIKVNWVIRKSGHGPAWMSPPYVTPFKKWLEKLVNTRLLTWFSPCIWGDNDGYTRIRKFLHGTRIGRAITDFFWKTIGNDVLTLNKFNSHPEMKKLTPWYPAMFCGTSFSILNYPTDFFELLRNGTVKIHIADITGLSRHTVHLSDGTQLESDTICCATGWKHLPPIKFLPKGIDKELGLPHKPEEEGLFKSSLVERADEEILSRFPRLKRQPEENNRLKSLCESPGISSNDDTNPYAPMTPYTLYHFIAPPSRRFLETKDVAFSGMVCNFSTILTAHIQGIWINAFFANKLPIDKSPDEIHYEAVLHARFGKWRYPGGHGARQPDFVFDAVPYLDLLLRDLGLNTHRKEEAGWFTEVTDPYGAEDYKGLLVEWIENQK
ncbi:FAD/NAD(P)-binding domain-containing protein [Podospora fimiseda]|uniref:FAD/NAD(P)-binding domain-containing protein n=1 Tax=Podospora fimiseda TaxID=252190 RepID=A0AAN7BL92_9PEZI|nr:FAD/NAD(P)-binding domain-containing protein [Podospora fimiseda]